MLTKEVMIYLILYPGVLSSQKKKSGKIGHVLQSDWLMKMQARHHYHVNFQTFAFDVRRCKLCKKKKNTQKKKIIYIYIYIDSMLSLLSFYESGFLHQFELSLNYDLFL